MAINNSSIKTLLVEDSPTQAGLIRSMLFEAMGVENDLEAVDNLEAGLACLSAGGIDVVLLDLTLPDSKGLDTLSVAHAEAPDVPIIVLTGLDDEELGIRAVQRGAQDYLVKGQVTSNLLGRAVHYAIERQRKELELRHYARELELINEDLDAFAHTVAHDLKNPLQNLLNCGMLLSDYALLEDDDIEMCVDTILQSTQKMNSIISNLHLLAEARKKEVTLGPLDMASIVSEAQQHLVHLIEEREAEITVPDAWPVSYGYAPWVEEVWVNYISNAVKYGGDPPQVELGTSIQSNGMVSFWVRDNGRGLTPDEQAQLFTPFVRLDQVDIKGYGLGLSIVKRIAAKLNGQVGVESASGEGSSFWFALPASGPSPN